MTRARSKRTARRKIKRLIRKTLKIICAVWDFIARHPASGYDPDTIQKEVNRILNGAAATTTKPQPADQTISKTVKSTCYAREYNKKLAGSYVTTADLYCRNDAGKNKKALCCIPKGTTVHNYGYYNTSNGTKWLYITVTLDGVEYIGFSSISYLKAK